MSFKNIFTALLFSALSAISFGQTSSQVIENATPATIEFRLLNDKKPDGLLQLKIDGTNETVFLDSPALTIEDVESANYSINNAHPRVWLALNSMHKEQRN